MINTREVYGNVDAGALPDFQREQFKKFFRKAYFVSCFLNKHLGSSSNTYESKQDDLAELLSSNHRLMNEFMAAADELLDVTSQFNSFWRANCEITQEQFNTIRESRMKLFNHDNPSTTNKNIHLDSMGNPL